VDGGAVAAGLRRRHDARTEDPDRNIGKHRALLAWASLVKTEHSAGRGATHKYNAATGARVTSPADGIPSHLSLSRLVIGL
jgi:hypothetical protein